MDFTESEVLDKDDDGEESADDILLAHRAASNGEVDTLSRAIQADPTALEYQDSDGLTPLAHSVIGEQLESVKLLVKMGANINAQDSLGRTCLSMASYQGWYEGVVFLLRNGAKQSITDKSGRTPLQSATYDTSTTVLKGLLHSLTVDEINQHDAEGMTALHWSSFHDRPQHMEILIAKGSEVNLQDIDGKTALHWAAQNGSVDCCAHLVNDPQGTALVNQLDASGKAAIHYAAAAGHCAVIRQLAAVPGCNLESEDPDERTPLHWAAATGQTPTVGTLLELNANPAPVDVEGATPLDYARQANHQECIQILEERLGLNASSNGNFNTAVSNANIGNNESVEQNKGRKNPLGFIVDFFRPKKAKNNHIEVSDESQATYNESDSSTSGYNINNRNLNQRTRLGAGSPNLHQNNGEEVRLSTPRRQKESEVIKSIEKLHVSRTDNPILLHRTPVKHPDHLPIANPISSSNPQTSSNSSSSEAESAIDHSMLIRSPPPMIKHEGSLSPPPPGVGAGWGRDHARLEEDAAQILAIHDTRWSNYGSTTSLTTSKSLTPLPAISARDYTPAELNMNAQDSPSVHLHQSKPHSLHLAPLKGPIPQLNNHTALRTPVNKALESIRKIPTSGPSRSPTPPARPSASTNSSHLSSHSPNASPGNRALSGANSQGKKKKKKKTQHPENFVGGDDSENWTTNVVDSHCT